MSSAENFIVSADDMVRTKIMFSTSRSNDNEVSATF